MSENSRSRLNTRRRLDSLCHVDRIADTFRIDDNVIFLTAFFIFQNIINDLLLVKVMLFRHKDTFCSIGNTAPQSKISRVTPHNFDDAASFMRRRSITYFIDRFHRRIYSSIKSDRVICAGNIKIDRSRNADRIYAEVRKFLSSGKRTVSSDNYKSVDTVFFTDCSRFLLSFFRTHRFTTRRLKERTSALDLLRHIAR